MTDMTNMTDITDMTYMTYMTSNEYLALGYVAACALLLGYTLSLWWAHRKLRKQQTN